MQKLNSSPRVNTRRTDPVQWIVSICLIVTLTIALTTCSTELEKVPVPMAQMPPRGEPIEQCSLLGTIACKAVAMASGDASENREATCVGLRKANGTLFEQCGTRETKSQQIAVEPKKASSVSVRLAWSDNSNNEQSFVIERCDQISFKTAGLKTIGYCTNTWTVVGNVGANITSFTDHSVLANRTYLYRVKAINSAGHSGYTNEALFTTHLK